MKNRYKTVTVGKRKKMFERHVSYKINRIRLIALGRNEKDPV